MDTFSKIEKQSEEKSKIYPHDGKQSMHDSLKFEAQNYFITDKLRNTKDFTDKKYSIKSDSNYSEPKRSKRERQIKSPEHVNKNFDEGMNLNSFSSRTIEENMSSKQVFLDNKIHMNRDQNRVYKVEKNPSLKTSNKQIKATFKRYNKNENLVAK